MWGNCSCGAPLKSSADILLRKCRRCQIAIIGSCFNADEILSIFHKRETDMVEGSDGVLRSTTVGYSITVLTKHQFNTKLHYSKEEKEKMENDFEIIKSMLQAVSQ